MPIQRSSRINIPCYWKYTSSWQENDAIELKNNFKTRATAGKKAGPCIGD
jgi:hypothetical protein